MSTATEAITFQFRCPRCYVALAATMDRVGESFVCPDCRTSGQIPEATPSRIAAAQTEQLPRSIASASSLPATWNQANQLSTDDEYRAALQQFRDEYGMVASPLARLLARLIDGVCLMGAFALGFPLVIGLAMISDLRIPEDVNQLTLVLFLVVAFSPAGLLTFGQWLWMASEGRTIGKRLMGIRIARRKDDLPPGFIQAVVLRSWLNYILGVTVPFYAMADIGYIFSQDARCLHDRLAGTVVLEGNLPCRAPEQR